MSAITHNINSLAKGTTGTLNRLDRAFPLKWLLPSPPRSCPSSQIKQIFPCLPAAAADYCVVPSRFEPCGLVAQCAMRYGAIPIVSTIGGMKDFVSPSLGYLMGPVGSTTGPERMRESVALMVAAMHQALADYNTPDFYRRRRACMMQDVGWAGPAKLWEAAMRGLVELGRSVRGGEGSR